MSDRATASRTAANGDPSLDWRQTLDAIPHHIIVLDRAGNVEHVNQQVLDYTGRTFEEIRMPGFRERFLHLDDWARLAPEREQGLRSGVRFQLDLRSRGKDGLLSLVSHALQPATG
jgi:PAS domain S-box-containing protein